jgi:NO-binding membrane sensor protein with MHYT domain
MHSNYNFWLVAVSLIVATLASFTAIDLADRLSILAYARARHLWLAAGALAMGVGIWSMHYTGMAAANFPVGSVCGAANGVKPQWLAAAVIPFAFVILIVTLLLSRLDARAAFLANSVARLNDQIDRMRGPIH